MEGFLMNGTALDILAVGQTALPLQKVGGLGGRRSGEACFGEWRCP